MAAKASLSKELPAIAGGRPLRAGDRRIVFGAPVIGKEEVRSITECLRSRWLGLGARVEEFEREFAAYKGAPYAAAVNSGTAALHVALVGLGIGPGDEVIVPAMTFCSAVHAVLHTGATPVLVDCLTETYNMDPAAIERRITRKTKAILLVHMGGRCAEMDTILATARRHKLRVIEDCAHAIESTYKDRPAGLMGDAGCFSFYATKNLTTGDGGMVITRDRYLHKRIKSLSLHGMNADAWTRFVGGPSGYEVVAAGFKYNMTDMAAAVGLPQLRAIQANWRRRKRLWGQYLKRLADLPLQLPGEDFGSRHAYHLFSPLVDRKKTKVSRRQVIEALRAENIGTGIHYVPVHVHPFYRKRFGFKPGDFPRAADAGQRTFSLPLSAGLSEADVDDVCYALHRIFHFYEDAGKNAN